MKKIKDFIYNNKKYILLFILLILFNICMASCNLPKAKAQTGIAELNDIWGKSWKINETISWPNSSSFDIYLNSNLTAQIENDYIVLGSTLYNNSTTNDIRVVKALSTGQDIPLISVERPIISGSYYLEFTHTALSGVYRISENISDATDGTVYTTNSLPLTVNFNAYNGDFDITANTTTYDLDYYISWWNNNFTEVLPPTQTNNLNIYVNDTLAYNDIIEFNNTGNPGIQFIYSNYTTNQFDFINNLAVPLKYTANEFIANVFNVSNETTTASSIDFAFNGSYLVGVSYDYINTSGVQVSNSYELSPDDDDSIRFLMFTDLQRNDTDINVRITTNNLNDFESGAVNTAFKTLFGFFNEIINIQFGFITIGQILGFILAIAIIGLIYKVWNGGNND